MKFKRLISGLIAAAVAVSTVTFSSFTTFAEDGVKLSGTCGENATWFINSDNSLVISGTGKVDSDSGWSAYQEGIKEIVIEEGITSIAKNSVSFYSCRNAEKIVFPSSLEELSHCLSSSMPALKDVWIFSKTLENNFSGNWGMYPQPGSITKWHVYEGSTTEASFRAGLKCTDADFEYITENDSFPKITNREPLVLVAETETSGPAGLNSSWSWDASTKTLKFSGSGVITIKTGFQKYASVVETVDMGDSEITSICEGAFGAVDFYGTKPALCPKLKHITFPPTLKVIGDYAFTKAPITEENFYLPDGLEKIGHLAFMLTNITGNLKLPSTVKSVGQQAFASTKISSVEIPEGVHFGGTVFSSCNNLKEVTVPVGCTYDKNGEGNMTRSNKLFTGCEGLEKVIIEDGAAIADSMFTRCTALIDVYILTKTADVNISKRSQEESAFGGNPTYHIYKGSTAESALKTSGYLTNDNIVYLADTTELEKAITDGEAVDAAKYTDDSVKVLTDAITAAKAVMENIDVAQSDIDNAVKAVTDAIAALELKIVTGNVSGKVNVSDGDTETEMTVKVVASDETETSVTATSMGTYTLEGLAVGEYTLTISGGKYVERTYEITVAEGDNAQDIELNPHGDINGDGKVTTADVGMANSHAKGVKVLEGYKFDCADVKTDGNVTTADVGMINSHAKSVKTLW